MQNKFGARGMSDAQIASADLEQTYQSSFRENPLIQSTNSIKIEEGLNDGKSRQYSSAVDPFNFAKEKEVKMIVRHESNLNVLGQRLSAR